MNRERDIFENPFLDISRRITRQTPTGTRFHTLVKTSDSWLPFMVTTEAIPDDKPILKANRVIRSYNVGSKVAKINGVTWVHTHDKNPQGIVNHIPCNEKITK